MGVYVGVAHVTMKGTDFGLLVDSTASASSLCE